MLSKVAIIGRTNVGKSTLFNRLLEKKQALVSKHPGLTRDRSYGQCFWRGQSFLLIDSAGIEKIIPEKEKKTLEGQIQKQAKTALEEADLILFIVDIQEGLMPQDRMLVKSLRKIKKPVILVANKADNLKLRSKIENREWLKLSFGKPLPVSGLNGIGSGDLLDEVIKKISLKQEAEEKKPSIRVAILGKPNVGKSSLINALLHEERAIVSEIPFTTRQPQDSSLIYKDYELILIDTAGIRRKAKIDPRSFEKMGVRQSLNLLKTADLALLLTEAQNPLSNQDRQLAELIIESGTGIILVANKWDLIEEKDTKKFTEYYNQYFPYLLFAPLIFVSAKTGLKTNKILDLILEVNQERRKKIEDNALDKFIKKIIKEHYPLKAKGTKYPFIYGMKQIGFSPPRFALTVGVKDSLHSSYLKLIEKKLRKKFGFKGTPLQLRVRTIR